MKAQEIRVGNYLAVDGGFQPVSEIEADSCGDYMVNIGGLDPSLKDYCHVEGCDVKPIPLTEEWLLKFGFNKVVYESTNDDFCDEICYELEYKREFFMSYADDFSLALFVDKKTHQEELGICIDAYHVHQLQNLYFALTGEELTLKQK